jgi:hypothetical protein
MDESMSVMGKANNFLFALPITDIDSSMVPGITLDRLQLSVDSADDTVLPRDLSNLFVVSV